MSSFSSFPLLGTFYYPWHGGSENNYKYWRDEGSPPLTWNSLYLPDVSTDRCFEPSVRLYDNFDSTILNYQFSLMERAGIDFIIWSWWGREDFTDRVLTNSWNNILPFFQNLKHCIYYEKEGYQDTPEQEIIDDINYIKSKYSGEQYLTIDGKPVIFVYNAFNSGDPTSKKLNAQKWNRVRQKTATYIVLKVFSGYTKSDIVGLVDSWHQYAPSMRYERQGNFSAFISPAFHKVTEESPRLKRDIIEFIEAIKKLKEDNVKFKLIQTWNEYGEGTQIEPAQKVKKITIDGVEQYTPEGRSYGEVYIDILSKYFL